MSGGARGGAAGGVTCLLACWPVVVQSLPCDPAPAPLLPAAKKPCAQLPPPFLPTCSYLELITFTSDLFGAVSPNISYDTSLPMWETEVRVARRG